MLDFILRKPDLRTFDGAAAAGADGGAVTGGNGNNVQEGGQPANPAKKVGKFDNVVFGKQADTEPAGVEAKETEPAATEKTPEQRSAEFEELIKGEYKSEFDKRTQKVIDRRFRENKELRENFARQDRVLGLLAERYGERNLDKLEELILNDKSHLEQEAYEKNMPVEQLIEIKRLQANAESERRARQRIESEMQADRQYTAWLNDAAKVKEKFPDFDLETEIQNPQFKDMLERGINVEHAYKVLHYDELMQGNIAQAMRSSAKATADTIAARGNRPKENGGNSSAIVYKTDVSKLSKEDRAEIARRVSMGETISF